MLSAFGVAWRHAEHAVYTKKSRALWVRDLIFSWNRVLVCSVRFDVDELASFFTSREHYDTVNEGEESVVFAHTYVKTWVVSCAALTLKDVASLALRSSRNFHTKSFAM